MIAPDSQSVKFVLGSSMAKPKFSLVPSGLQMMAKHGLSTYRGHVRLG